ncbi:MAG: ComF family protein [Polyangiaceae bacterium]|nr:ComF family protein [Myxococcales bacterium]MCB9589534.1 ComF family protein [Polyangiaceae bacterium]MCB9609162.1 ComF family protein [Polyangiaceae bacterium]
MTRGLAALAGAPRCVACGATLEWAESAFCGGCVAPSPPILREASGLWVLAGGRFEAPLREAIHRLKYSGQAEVVGGLATWWLSQLGDALQGTTIPHANSSRIAFDLVPIPLHPTRLVERGYNQSALLAAKLAPRLAVRVRHQLKREKSTRPQAGLGRAERQQNIQAAFRAAPGRESPPAILVDDVATTGATLAAAAAALRAQGVQCLGAVVLATSGE